MKFGKNELEHCISIAKQCVLFKRQYIKMHQKKFLIWPLFFSDGTQPKEESVDVCTSALGIISCSCFAQQSEHEILSTIKDGISTILFVRNQDGSWPSKVSLVTKDTLSMEGVISDTYFALSALNHVGFITNTPLIDNMCDPPKQYRFK